MKQATPTRNVREKWSKWTCQRLLRLCIWDTFPLFWSILGWQLGLQESSESKAEERQLQNLQKSRRPMRRCEGFDNPRVGNIRKKHQKRWKTTRNDTFTPENKNRFFPQNFFLQQKLFYTRNTCASESEVSLHQTHFTSSSANLLHHRKSLTPHTFAGAQIPGNDLEVNCWII